MSTNLREQIKDQIDGQNEKNNELIIEKESQKFMETLTEYLAKMKLNLLI